MVHDPAKLCLNAEGPAPPSPGSARSPLEGVSTEETLQRLRGDGQKTPRTQQIVTRTPKDFFFIKVLGEGSFSTVGFH